jgi:kinesin family protein 2/24
VHEPKLKVDGVTKVVENHNYEFDNAFDLHIDTQQLYNVSLKPIIPILG